MIIMWKLLPDQDVNVLNILGGRNGTSWNSGKFWGQRTYKEKKTFWIQDR